MPRRRTRPPVLSWPRPGFSEAEIEAVLERDDRQFVSEDEARRITDGLGVIIRDNPGSFAVLSHPFFQEILIPSGPSAMVKSMAFRVSRGWALFDRIKRGEDVESSVIELFSVHVANAYRLEVFQWVMNALYPRVPEWVGPLLIQQWVRSEIFAPIRANQFARTFAHYRPELAPSLADLPPTDHPVYRLFHGVEYDHRRYVPHSWTLSEDIAVFFSGRFVDGGSAENRPVYVLDLPVWAVHKYAVFYSNERNEEELFFERDPRTIPTMPFTFDRPGRYNG